MNTNELSFCITHLLEWLTLEITSDASEDAEKLDHACIGDGKVHTEATLEKRMVVFHKTQLVFTIQCSGLTLRHLS